MQNIGTNFFSILQSNGQHIIQHLVDLNTQKMVKSTIKTHEKKLKNLMKNSLLTFTLTDTALNLSNIKLTEEELEILNGLKQPIKSAFINKTDTLTTFYFIHRAMNKDLKDNKDNSEVKDLANPYI